METCKDRRPGVPRELSTVRQRMELDICRQLMSMEDSGPYVNKCSRYYAICVAHTFRWSLESDIELLHWLLSVMSFFLFEPRCTPTIIIDERDFIITHHPVQAVSCGRTASSYGPMLTSSSRPSLSFF